MADVALAYHEPEIVTILILSSFLLVLNAVGFALDHVFYCGLVGQVLTGMAWGTPGAKILSYPFEEAVTQLGYLGLIMIVFEGGLATSAKSLRSSLFLSVCVALTGIGVPMALSFSLVGMSNATELQGFAAGAALCSTSLGTTFSLLKTTGLTKSRLGTVLTSAAMLDDVVGLALVEVISNLGSGHTSISAATVIRPVFVSLAFALVMPVMCKFLLKPIIHRCSHARSEAKTRYLPDKLGLSLPLHFLFSTTFLAALVTAASYAGTSNLFAAYLAGAIISWTDEVISHPVVPQSENIPGETPRDEKDTTDAHPGSAARDTAPTRDTNHIPDSVNDKTQDDQTRPIQPSRPFAAPTPPPEDQTGADTADPNPGPTDIPKTLDVESRSLTMYNDYYAPAVDFILKPFFFASIGFSIPISKMFHGPVIWRGLIYAVLMAMGKLCCSLWLIRFRKPSPSVPTSDQEKKDKKEKFFRRRSLPRPKSFYPACLLGCAMIARGEIGFLISALAATNGIFSGHDSTTFGTAGDSLSSELYLVVTWAILLCTVVGPLALGFLAKRVKRLQDERKKDAGHEAKEDPLGIWGVN